MNTIIILKQISKVLFVLPFLLTRSEKTSSQSVGIGTITPTAMFHTKGTLRFEGLTNNNQLTHYAVMDANGNVSWKNETVIPANNAWLLSGNSVTDNNFLGTINDHRLIIKTNNVEQLTVLSNGNIGVGTSAPNRKLTIYNSLVGFNNELVLKQGAGSQFGAFITFDNTANPYGKFWSIGSSGTLNTSGQFGVPGSLEFYQFDAGPTERVRMIITSAGLVGIHVNVPTARLHVDGTVRFENLPAGTGTALVINSNGEIMRSSTTLQDAGGTSNMEIENLKQEIINLKMKIAKIESSINTK